MIRKNYLIPEDQVAFLESLPGTASEHLRAAINDYMMKKQKEKAQASTSPSYNRREETHG